LGASRVHILNRLLFLREITFIALLLSAVAFWVWPLVSPTVGLSSLGSTPPGPGCWQSSNPPGTWTSVACASGPIGALVSASGILGWNVTYQMFTLTAGSTGYFLSFQNGGPAPPSQSNVGSTISVIGYIPWLGCPVAGRFPGCGVGTLVIVQSWNFRTTTTTNTSTVTITTTPGRNCMV
jgi:hypothetical protein